MGSRSWPQTGCGQLIPGNKRSQNIGTGINRYVHEALGALFIAPFFSVK